AGVLKNLITPVPCSERHQLRVRSIRILGHRFPAKEMRDVLGKIQPMGAGIDACQLVGVKLVERVQAQQLYSRKRVEPVRGNEAMNFRHCFCGSLIPVTKWIPERAAVSPQAHIVNSPPVRSDRWDSFGRGLRAGSEASAYALGHGVDVPVESRGCRDRGGWNGMNDFSVEN